MYYEYAKNYNCNISHVRCRIFVLSRIYLSLFKIFFLSRIYLNLVLHIDIVQEFLQDIEFELRYII